MALNDMLVCLDSSGAGEVRLRLAAHVAHDQGAYLLGVYPLLDTEEVFEQREPSGAAHFNAGLALAERDAEGAPGLSRSEQIEQRFRETLRQYGVHGDWRLIDGPDTAELLALTKSVDLAVLGQFARESRNRAAFRPDEVAVACGRPVLIVPYAGEFERVGEQVLVAWDGTREATRAVNDTLPLLSQAKVVTVVTVIVHQGEFEGAHAELQRIVRHLERHGIPARSEEAVRGDLNVSDVLLSRAADLGADMIVAGAYHHSQLREALLGGVSRDLLQHMTVPVLMSH